MIIVQHIRTRWTKASRGMPGAAVRNTVPRTMPLQPVPDPAPGIHLHGVSADEADGFELRQKSAIIASGQQFTTYWSLRFHQEGASVRVEFRYLMEEHGLPGRERPRHPLFTLAPGEIGALHINGRFNYTSVQYYEQHFVNIANVHTPSPGLFTDRHPDYFVDMTANLF
jgi:hypothetical protein